VFTVRSAQCCVFLFELADAFHKSNLDEEEGREQEEQEAFLESVVEIAKRMLRPPDRPGTWTRTMATFFTT
jgi:hypothetical protein